MRNFLTRLPNGMRNAPLTRVRAFRFFPFSPKGSSWTVLHCAHRTSTVSSCAFCEQEEWSPAPSLALNRNVEGISLPIDQQEGKIGWLDRIGQSLKHGEVVNRLSIEFEHDVTGLKT